MSLRDRYEKAREQNAARYQADKTANERHGRPSEGSAWGCVVVAVVIVLIIIVVSLVGG